MQVENKINILVDDNGFNALNQLVFRVAFVDGGNFLLRSPYTPLERLIMLGKLRFGTIHTVPLVIV